MIVGVRGPVPFPPGKRLLVQMASAEATGQEAVFRAEKKGEAEDPAQDQHDAGTGGQIEPVGK